MPMRLGIGDAALHDRVDAALDVLDAVDAQGAVVEVDEALAEARGAAHVRREDGDPAREQRLVEAAEAGALLALGAAVERQHGGEGRGAGGPVEPARELEAVVGLESDELGPDELAEVDSRVGALRDLAERAGRDVHDPDVGGRRGPGDREGQRPAVLRKVHAEPDLGGKLRPGDGLSRREVEELELAFPGDVPQDRGLRPRVVERERAELPVLALGEDGQFPGLAVRGEVEPCEGGQVASGVGLEIDGAAVLARTRRRNCRGPRGESGGSLSRSRPRRDRGRSSRG